MVIRTTVAAALVLSLVACGGGGDSESDAGGPVPTWAPSAASARDTCERSLTATRDLDVTESAGMLDAALEQLATISDEGDADTKAVLAGVIDGVRQLRATIGRRTTQEQRQQAFDALTAYSDAANELGEWCRAAGLSAY